MSFLAYNVQCNVCFRSSTAKLLNICDDIRHRKQYQILQLLASPQLKIDTKEFWVCATCEMILHKISEFQQQLFRTHKQMSDIIARRKEDRHLDDKIHNTPTAASSERDFTDGLNQTVEKIKIELSDENNESNGVVFLEVQGSHHIVLEEDHDREPLEFIDLDDESCDNYNASHYDDDQYSSNSDYELPVIKKVKLETERTPIKNFNIYSKDDILPIIESLKTRYVNNLKCCICDFTPSSRGSMISHMQFLHEEESIGWCKLCNCLESSHNESKCSNNLVCKFCQLMCEDPLRLIEHLYTHSDNSDKKVVDTFVSEAEPKPTSQPEMPRPITRKQYVCRRCKAVFMTESSVRLHKCGQTLRGKKKLSSGILGSSGILSCTNCDKVFCNPEKLLEHVRTHKTVLSVKMPKTELEDDERTPSVEKPFICEYCGKAFAQENIWAAHLKLHTDRVEKCTQCEKTFSKSSELRVHLRNTHLDVKPAKTFLCNTCGHAARTQGQLNDHMNIHSDERNHICKQCGMTFKQKGTLKNHMAIHADFKRHKCPECPYSSHHSDNMKTHAKKHANEAARLAAKKGEKIFMCDHCSKPFTTEELLLEHIRCTHAIVKS